jgi:hypothetical protein
LGELGTSGGAADSTLLEAKGGVWHKKDREKGEVPHTSIETETHWGKSGWHGWVYGWKLHLTPANVADSRIAERLIEELPEEARFVLGDTHYNAPEVRAACVETERFLVASGGRGPYPHTDAGVGVRRVFHGLRHVAIENFRASISRPSSTPTGRCPPRERPIRRASPWERCSSTRSRCSTVTSTILAQTSSSKPSSEPLEQL